MTCPHSLAHKTDEVAVYNCDLSEKGHKEHRDQFNRVSWIVERHQTPLPSMESGRRVSWSTDVKWRRF